MPKYDYTDYLENTRQVLNRVMNQKRWSQREVARKCHLHRNEISGILNGEKKDLKLSTITNIAEGLGLPLSTVIGANETLDSESNQFIMKLYVALGEYIREIDNGNATI